MIIEVKIKNIWVMFQTEREKKNYFFQINNKKREKKNI